MDYTTERVNQLVKEIDQQDENDMRQSSIVRNAQAALDNAQAWLQREPHAPDLQLAARQAQTALYAAQNEFHRTRRLAAIEADRAAKAAVVEQEQAARAAQYEASAKSDMRESWISAGGTSASFEAAWSRPGGLWEQEIQRRALEQDRSLTEHILVKTGNAGL